MDLELLRKDIPTHRCISKNSHHSSQFQITRLIFLIHRLLGFPLGTERFEKDTDTDEIAATKEYLKNLIDNVTRNTKFTIRIDEISTFKMKIEELNLHLVLIITIQKVLESFSRISILKLRIRGKICFENCKEI